MRRFIILLAVTGVLLCIHLLFFTQWAASRYYINMAVLLIVAITLHRGIAYGAGSAILVGLAESSISAIPGPSHMIALVITVLATWFFSNKLFTIRSSVSLLFTTAMATAINGLAFMASESLITLFNHQRLHASYLAVLMATLITIITHPILISLLWRWKKWDRYSQVASAV